MFHWQQLKTSLKSEDRHFFDIEPSDIPTQTVCFALDDYQIITVSGANAVTFLQGQCTCNFMTLGDSGSTYGSHCTPKGRMVASFVAKKININGSDTLTIGLRVHKSTAEHLRHSLAKYAVFSKVGIETNSSLQVFAFLGSDGLKIDDDETSNSSESKQTINPVLFKHENSLRELWITDATLNSADNLIDNSNTKPLLLADTRSWELLQIRQGIYNTRGETSEKLLPQEINHQLLGAIDFTKGCYTGQEIIARLHYKGQLKKHMRRVQLRFEDELPSTIAALDGIVEPALISEIIPKTVMGQPLIAIKTDSNIDILTLVSDSIIEQNLDTALNDLNAKITWPPLPYAIP